MGKLIKWSLIALVVALIVSNISIKTSLYKAKDNSVEISFPQMEDPDSLALCLLDPRPLALAVLQG